MSEETPRDDETLPEEVVADPGTRPDKQDDVGSKGSRRKGRTGKMVLRGIFAEKLSDELFEKMAAFVNTELGIKMPDRKQVMLEARLRKRLRALDMNTFEEYAEYVFSPGGLDHEVVHLLDVVTTNKTDFFREPRHYDLLTNDVLPELIARKGRGEPIKMWSAACSSGEEPYTLAIVLSEYALEHECPPFSIIGTDVSTDVLYKALDAVYKERAIKEVSESLKKKYFLRGKDREKNFVRVSKQIRDKVSFRRLNFMDETYDVDSSFDIVFCRNVMIYFDRPTQEMVINRICRHIKVDGYLFMGHAETLMGIRAPLKQQVSTVYRRLPGTKPVEGITPMRLNRKKEQKKN